MFYTDPKTKKPVSFHNMVLAVFGREVWFVLLGRGGKVVTAVPCSSRNAMSCYRACRARGLVAPMHSAKGEAFLRGGVEK